MMRVVSVLVLVAATEAAFRTAPLAATKVSGHVQLSAEQQKTMHSGCVNACKPSPVESKCVTACEAAMYKCIDETGPNETEEDTKKCEDGVLKKYTETKGLPKKEEKKEEGREGKGKKEGAKKEEKKEEKKASSFMQIAHDDEEDLDEEDAAVVNTDDEIDESSGEDDSEGEDADDEEDSEEDDMEDADAYASMDEDSEEESEDGSFVQVGDIGEDDENAADTAQMEDKIDKIEGADEEVVDETDKEHTQSDDEEDAAETAKMEDDADKLEGENSDEKASTSDEEGSESEDDESFLQEKISWKPEHGSGVDLYEHPQGSTVITSCPISSQTNTESCGAYFSGKADGAQCPQITCPKALGVTMKLTCSGGCCPTCWAPDHVIAVDRHTSISDAAVVDAAPQAATSCGGVKCFKLLCGAGHTEGFVNGACCYSCIPGR